MDAIRKIEAALAAGPTEGPWSLFGADGDTGWHLNQKGGPGFVATLPLMSHRKAECTANAEFIAACNPSAIREVLQTLASKEAELVRLLEAMLEGARRIESLKRACGADPESITAIQNGRCMSVSNFLRASTQPPKEPT